MGENQPISPFFGNLRRCMLLEIAVPLLLKGYYAMRAIRKEQLEFLKWEMGVFFHFGIRTFFEGHQDWDMREMPLDRFNPVNLDCEQWIKTVKEGGAKVCHFSMQAS